MRFLMIIVFLVSCPFVFSQNHPSSSPEQKIQRLFTLLRTQYVDTVNIDKIVEVGIKAILEHLDPHSVYMTAEELKKANEPLQGNFEGVGIQYQIVRDTVQVIAVVPGGPSELVGIMPGDKIVKIDGEDFVGKVVTITSVMERLRGPKGTKVVIGLIRPPSNEVIEFEIIRDRIPIQSIDASFMLTQQTGYIKLSRFARNSPEELSSAISDLLKKGAKNLILDLRNNSGGFLTTAVDVANQFLPPNRLIVYTEGLHSKRESFFSKSEGLFREGRLIILIDQGSASASEIVAGAVQDWDRGVIIGRRSFGKGLVQRPFQFADGSGIRLTTSRYYTPTGRCIQKPYDDNKKKYVNEINERLKRGELFSQDSIVFPDSLSKYTPAGRKVYGGGGIVPDIFVPLDTFQYGEFYQTVSRRNLINAFVVDYMQAHRKKLQRQYSSVELFKKDYLPMRFQLMQEFINYAISQGVEYTEMNEKTKNYLSYLLVALIARHTFNPSAFYYVLLDIDRDITVALDVIESEKYQDILQSQK